MKKILCVTLILIIPSFVAWGIGARGRSRKNMAASVNRHDISYNQFGAVVQRYYDYYKEIYKDEFTEEAAKKLKFEEKALDNLIEDLLLTDEARRQGIKTVRPEDIEKKVRENAFFKNEQGEFDREKYNFYLKGWRASVWEYLREQARHEIIKEELIQRLKDSIKVTEKELQEAVIKENELVRVKYVSFAPSLYLSQIKPTEEELKAYYEKHKNELEKPESINIEYLAIRPDDLKKEITITPEEVKKYYESHAEEFHKPEEIRCRHILMRAPPDAPPEKIKGILKEFDFMMGKYKEEVTFETLARVYSEDYKTRAEGGDLGYFSRGTMPPELEEAAFTLKAGEVSQVVKTGQGYHLIKLEDRRPPHDETLEQASATIKDKLMDEQAQIKAREKAEEIAEEVYDAEGLLAASKKYNIPLEESGFFAKGEEIKGLGRSYEIGKTAFQIGEDEVSPLVDTPQGYTLFRVKEKKPAYIPEFEAVKKEIEDKVKEEKARAMAKEKAEECLKKLKSGEDFNKVAKESQVEIREPEPFNRQGYLKKVDYSKDFGRICFGLKKDEYGGLAETQQGFYIFKLVEKIPADPAKFNEVKSDFKKRLLQEKAYYLYQEWYDHLKKDARIKTYI